MNDYTLPHTHDAQPYIEARASLFELLSSNMPPEPLTWLEAERLRLSAIITPELTGSSSAAHSTVNARVTLTATLISALGESLLEARRRFSHRHVITSFAARTTAQITSGLGAQSIGHWKRDEAAKLWLISALVADHFNAADAYQALYQIYNASDTAGRVVCLRALNFVIGSPQAGLVMIHDAGRTYLNELMEAAWCHSPFARAHLSTEEHRKAVLKALFCDVPVSGFLGLEERADAELSRRLCEYANEREAAGRVVPLAVLRVASFYPQPGLVSRLIGRLEHPSAEERLTAAVGLERAGDRRALSFIEERTPREDDPEVLSALKAAIAHLSSDTSAND